MDASDKNRLESKKAILQKKLQIKADITAHILYNWLDYYQEMLQLGMQIEVKHLSVVPAEDLEAYQTQITELGNPLLKASDLKTGETCVLDEFFEQFPSTSLFKYEIDAPTISLETEDIGAYLLEAAHLLGVQPTEVLFYSNDFNPVVSMRWEELIQHADQLFSDGGRIGLIFCDPQRSWLIFRSIEEHWHYSKWRH